MGKASRSRGMVRPPGPPRRSPPASPTSRSTAPPLASIAALLGGAVLCRFVAGGTWCAPVLVAGLAWPPWRRAALAALVGLLGALQGPGTFRPPQRGLYAATVRCVAADVPRAGRQRVVGVLESLDGQRVAPGPAQRMDVGVGVRRPTGWTPGERLEIALLQEEGPARPAAAHAWRRLAEAPAPRRALHDARSALARRFGAQLSARAAAWQRALLLGDRGALSRADVQAFRETGQAHLLAVSGLHVGLVLGLLLLGLRLLGCRPTTQAWLALPCVLLYVPLVGAPSSAVRAGVAAVLFLTTRGRGRLTEARAVLGATALLVLAFDGGRVGDLAAWLSFSAVLGILTLSRPILLALVRQPLLHLPGFLEPPRARLRRGLAVSLAAWLATAPWIALVFGRLTPWGPLLSLALVPLLACVLALGLGAALLGDVPLAGAVARTGAEWSVALLAGAGHAAAGAGLGSHAVAPGVLSTVAHVAALVALARARTARQSRALLALLAGTVLATTWGTQPAGRARPRRGYDPGHVPTVDLASIPLYVETRPLVFAGVVVVGAVFAVLAVRPLGWLTRGGAGAALALAVGTGAVIGPAGLAALFAPFVIATLLGRLPGWPRSGARDARQVVANGLPAGLGVLCVLLGPVEAGLALFLGGLACLGSDTCATEVGVRWGGTPRHLLTGRALPRGESGGVTGAGLLGALFGACLAPGAFALAAGAPLHGLPALAAAAGLAGSLVDSLLGAHAQYRGRHPTSGEVVEERHVAGQATQPVRGLTWLDNDGVNLASGLIAALLAVAAAGLLAP